MRRRFDRNLSRWSCSTSFSFVRLVTSAPGPHLSKVGIIVARSGCELNFSTALFLISTDAMLQKVLAEFTKGPNRSRTPPNCSERTRTATDLFLEALPRSIACIPYVLTRAFRLFSVTFTLCRGAR